MTKPSMLEKSLSLLSRFVAGRLIALGFIEDELLNVVAFDGKYNQTLSVHAALAARKGKKWGCILCKMLSWMVQKDHCEKTLTDEPIPFFDCIRAFFWISATFAILILVLKQIFFFLF